MPKLGRNGWCAVWFVSAWMFGAGVALAADGSECPKGIKAVSATDPEIPVDELELRLLPLTRCELQAEVEAWLLLLQAKVKAISEAEIAVKYKTEEIEKAKDVAKAQDAIKEARQKADRDEAADAAKKAQEAAKAAQEAQVKAEKDQGVKEAVDTAVSKVTEDAKTEPAAKASAAREPIDESADEKAALLKHLTALRAERTALKDRFNVVLAAFKAKGGKTEEYDQYVKAVSGIKVDVTDTSATWVTLTGWLTSAEGGLRWAVNIAQFVIIVMVFYFLSLIAGKATQTAVKRAQRLSTLLSSFLVTMVRRIILFIGFFVGLSALEVNVGPVLAVVGAAGFVIAFALQNSLSNFASGILMLIYRPFDVGDAVDVAGTQGKVESMNLLSTYIKTFDNKVVIVPNNSVWGDVITNMTGSDKRRVDMVFGIGYEDDIDHAQRVLQDIIDKHELVLDDPEPIVRLHELGDSSVNFVCRPWVRPDDYWNVYWDVTRAVKQRFDAEGISIPFPQRDVHIYSQQKPAIESGS